MQIQISNESDVPSIPGLKSLAGIGFAKSCGVVIDFRNYWNKEYRELITEDN